MKKKFNNILISNKSTISDVLNKINSNKLQFCFLVDEKDKVKGIVTDGDIRRAILNNFDLKDPVSKIANKKFRFLYENEVFLNNKLKYLDKFDVKHLPVLNKENILVDFISNIQKKESYDYKKIYVMILAGGYGKRLMPLTKNLPKPMVKLQNKPILEHLINKLEYFDLKNIIVSTFYKSNEIKKYFSNGKKYNVDIKYTKENKPLGTAGPINFLKNINSNTFIIINSDVFTNIDMHKIIKQHIKSNNDITILTTVNKTHINFGVIKHSGKKVLKVIEKPIIQNKVLGGIYIVNKNIVRLCKDKYLDMDELINRAIEKKFKVSFYNNVNAYWFDLGSINELEKVENLNLNVF